MRDIVVSVGIRFVITIGDTILLGQFAQSSLIAAQTQELWAKIFCIAFEVRGMDELSRSRFSM